MTPRAAGLPHRLASTRSANFRSERAASSIRLRTELYLEGRPPTGAGVDDGIHLEAGVVAVVVQFCAHGLGVDTQIPDHHRLEEKAEPGEIAEQVFRSRAERRRCDGWIHEVTLWRYLQSGSGPQMRCPRRLVFHNHEAFEAGEVRAGRVAGHRGLVRTGNVAGDGCEGRVGRDVSSQRLEATMDSSGVSPHSVDALEIGTAYVVHVASVHTHGLFGRGAEMPRPTTDASQFSEFVYGRVGRRIVDRCSLKHTLERHLAGAAAQFEERHGTQAHPDDSASPGVACDVIGRNGRSGKDEMALSGTRIHCAADMVPDHRGGLPLVDQSRSWRHVFNAFGDRISTTTETRFQRCQEQTFDGPSELRRRSGWRDSAPGGPAAWRTSPCRVRPAAAGGLATRGIKPRCIRPAMHPRRTAALKGPHCKEKFTKCHVCFTIRIS